MVDAPLRIDWLDEAHGEAPERGSLGLTILPGKHGPSSRYPGRVYRRDLAADLEALRHAGVVRLLLLVEDVELQRWGEPAIVATGAAHGVEIVRHPMPDGCPPASCGEMDDILDEIASARWSGNVAVACMGGVGRSGTVAACALVADGLTVGDAIGEVRRVRHPQAVETPAQVSFVRRYAVHLGGGGTARA